MTGKNWLQIFGLALLWGGSFFFVELALRSFPPFTLVLARVAIAAALTGWVVRRRNLWGVLRGRWRAYLPLAFVGSAFPFACFAWGQQRIDSSLAGVLNALTPFCVFIFSAALGREMWSWLRGGGILLGIAGVAVLLRPDAPPAVWGGVAAVIVGSVSYAVAAVFAWWRVRNFPPLENVFGQLFFSAALLLPLALLERPWLMNAAEILPVSWAALAALTVFCTFAAYWLYYKTLADAGAVNATLFVLLLPVVATALGVLVLKEPAGAEFFAGAGLILSGMAITDANLRRALARLFAGARR